MRALPVLLIALAACHHSDGAAPNAPVSTVDQDALWRLAPDGAVFGMVASPRALAMTDHAWVDVRRLLATAPELATTLAEVDLVLGADPSLASFGLSSTKGGALFVVEGSKLIAIVPVGDRAKFLAAVHGTKGEPADTIGAHMTCTTTHGVYACASDPALFDRLGKGSLTAALAGRRGDIELAAQNLPIDRSSISFAVVAELARGAFTLHGTVAGLSHDTLHALGGASPPRLDDRTTGFAIAHVKHAMTAIPGDNGPLVDGVTQDELRATIDDPVTAVMHAGSLDLRIPVSDPVPARKVVIDHCSDGPLGELGAVRAGRACRLTFPNLPGVPIDLSVDDHAITVAWTGGVVDGAGVEPTALGKEFEATPWQLAMYGRGSLLGAGSLFAKQQKLAELPAKGMFAIRGVAFLDELGLGLRVDGDRLQFVFGVRTAWSNPDDVVAKLLALDPAAVTAGKADAAIKAIVDAAPNAPLAGDLRAGYAGLFADVTVVGVIAAVAIPAYLDYIKRSKSSPAEVELNVIGHDLKRTFNETSAYPIGDAALLPAGPCCGQHANRCAIDPAAFANDPVWKQIDFVPDDPTQYQFRYHSDDGKTATVEAIGDIDCDGKPAVYTLHVSVTPGGTPKTELEPPPAGVY